MTTGATTDFVNHRGVDEPLAARGRGPDALVATVRWLHRAFIDLRFEVHEIAVLDDRAVAWVTLHGTSSGPFVRYDADGAVAEFFPRMIMGRRRERARVAGGR